MTLGERFCDWRHRGYGLKIQAQDLGKEPQTLGPRTPFDFQCVVADGGTGSWSYHTFRGTSFFPRPAG